MEPPCLQVNTHGFAGLSKFLIYVPEIKKQDTWRAKAFHPLTLSF